jgi:Ca2+-binding EF-hand superfamily protein
MQRMKSTEKEINKEVVRHIYWDEIQKSNEIFQKKFKKLDHGKDGYITLFQLKKALFQCNMITPKEFNMIIRSIKTDLFEYKTFQDILYDVRYELTKSRIMDTNIGAIQ